MDEFLGEENVSFTEESLLALSLYYVTGTVTASGGTTTEVVYVYLLDPVYGTVCVYQLKEGDTINGNEITNIDPAYTNTFGNVSYYGEEGYEGTTFAEALGITFYESTDYIGEDGIILEETDEGYNEEDNLFSAILEATDCASGAIAIGYFECANCGMKVPVYASAAHTFETVDGVDTGLDMTAPKTESGRATYNWTDATCTEAASHTGICSICGEVTVYGEGKLGHEYDYTIEADEEANEIYVTAECDRCGDETTLSYALYVQSGTGDYHLAQNPLTGKLYFEACGESCTAGETKYDLNPGIAGLTVSRYAASDFTYDEKSGIWATTEEATEGDPTCTEGAYNVYTLDGKTYSASIGATYVNEESADENIAITAVWYVEPTGNVLKLGTIDDRQTAYVTITLADGYTWADGTDGDKRYAFMVLDSVAVPTVSTGTWAAYDDTAENPTDYWATLTDGLTITFDVGLAEAIYNGTIIVSGDIEITSDGSNLTVDTLTAVGTYSVTFTLASGYAWEDGSDAPLTFTFTVVAGTATAPTADSWENTDANGAYYTDDNPTDGITLTTIQASDFEGYTVYVNGEKADLSSMEEGGPLLHGSGRPHHGMLWGACGHLSTVHTEEYERLTSLVYCCPVSCSHFSCFEPREKYPLHFQFTVSASPLTNTMFCTKICVYGLEIIRLHYGIILVCQDDAQRICVVKMAYGDIAKSVMNLIDGPVDCRIRGYGEDFLANVEDSYILANYGDGLMTYYTLLFEGREKLSGFSPVDFRDGDFLQAAFYFLDCVEAMFTVYYMNRRARFSIVDDYLLRKVVEGDVSECDDGSLRVGLGNPLILESVILAKLQRDDFNLRISVRGENVTTKLYREHLMCGIEELFRGITILYRDRFYRIVGYGGCGAFIARSDEDAAYEGSVSFTDLYGAVSRSASSKAGSPLKALVIGSMDPSDAAFIGDMLADDGLDVSIDCVTGKDGIGKALRRNEFEKAIEEHDDVYVLDCPQQYVTVVGGRKEPNIIINWDRKPVSDDLGVHGTERDLKNENEFARLYLNVQNCLLKVGGDDLYMLKTADRPFLWFMAADARRNIKRGSGKNVRAYYSRGTDLESVQNDCYDTVCTEGGESKGFRFLDFGVRTGITETSGNSIRMTYLDVLNAVSPSLEFYRDMTGVSSGGDERKALFESVRLAGATLISIGYGAVTEKDGKRAVDVRVDVRLSNRGPLPKDCFPNITQVVGEMFKCLEPPSGADRELGLNLALEARNGEAAVNLLFEHARSVNDMLFCHMCSQKREYGGGPRFDLSFKVHAGAVKAWPGDACADGGTRFCKHTLRRMMDDLDGVSFDDVSAMGEMRLVNADEEKLKRYMDTLKTACEALGYTYGGLYDRVEKYFDD